MKRVAVIKKRILCDDHYVLIVPDISAGLHGRYTVYLVPPSPGVWDVDDCAPGVKCIGRELPLRSAKRCAKSYLKKDEK